MSPFWQMFWADALWSLVWMFGVSIPAILVYGWVKGRRRKAKKGSEESVPRMVMLTLPTETGRCPLCGQGWTLAGPVAASLNEAEDNP